MIKIEEHLGLVKSIARKFKTLSFDDAFQSGCEGLIVAAKRYKDGETEFGTFASRYIYGYIYNYITSTQAIRKPQRVRISNKKIKELKKVGITEPEEIANKLGLSLDVINEAIALYNDFAPLYDEVDESKVVKDDYDLEEEVIHNLDIQEQFNEVMVIINTLPIKQKEIVLERFYHGKTQAEVGKERNRTRQAIQNAEKLGMQKIRDSLAI